MNEDIINEKSIEVLNSLRSEGLQTPDIVEVLKKALSIHGVVGQSEQYCECGWLEKGEKKELNSYLVCKHCDKFL